MNKATKGALAAVAAGTLMLGGAGTLAYWTSAQNVSGANVNTGHLTLGAPDCSVASGTHGWKFNGADYVSQVLVPGDQLTEVCNLTLGLAGDNIGATLAITGGAIGATGTELTKSVVFKEGATTIPDGTVVTGAGSHTYQATLTVTLPTGATASQDVATALSDVTLTASQTHA